MKQCHISLNIIKKKKTFSDSRAMKYVKKNPGQTKQEAVEVAASPAVVATEVLADVPAASPVVTAVEQIAPAVVQAVVSTTPSDEISVDDFLGLGK